MKGTQIFLSSPGKVIFSLLLITVKQLGSWNEKKMKRKRKRDMEEKI